MASDPQQVSFRVQALDLLRLLSVLCVALYHYGFRGPVADGATLVAVPGLSPVAMYGFLGVPVFFIISGFVIAYSAEGRTATGFAIARFSRIYPTFLVCMTLTFLVLLVFGKPHFETSVMQWLANLFIAAPSLGQPYMDGAYWSLVVEVTFYVWVALLIATGLFPRRIDALVLAWLCISMANELTIDARLVERIFLADDSGFFATGLMIYEHYRGRRDAMLYGILTLSIGTAVFQAVHNLGWLRVNSGEVFQEWIVAAICLGSIAVIFLASRVRRVPLPAGLVMAAGAITYPLYLLHMQLGYTLFAWAAPRQEGFAACAILLGTILLSWAVWRYVERPLQHWTKVALTNVATRSGWPSKAGLLRNQ